MVSRRPCSCMKHEADDLPRLPLFGPANSRGNRGRDRARGPEAGSRRDAALDPAIQACQGCARAVRVDCASSSQAVQLVDGRREPRIPRVRHVKRNDQMYFVCFYLLVHMLRMTITEKWT
jgi:hypothetical protein